MDRMELQALRTDAVLRMRDAARRELLETPSRLYPFWHEQLQRQLKRLDEVLGDRAGPSVERVYLPRVVDEGQSLEDALGLQPERYLE